MKIIHLERNFIKATETFIANQINALSKDTENYVFTAQKNEHLDANADIRVPEPQTFGTKLLRRRHKKFFLQQAKKISPDIIHAHFITDACLFHPFTKKLSTPKVCSCYGWDVTEVPVKFKYIYKFFYKKVILEYDCFLAMSEDMKTDLMSIGVPENKIVVHYHGINTANFDLPRNYDLSNGVLNLLTIASFREKKGHATVLKALKTISQSRPEIDFKYHIIGSGPLEAELKSFVNENNLKDKVIFHGLIKHGENLKKFIQSADLFLHPSVTTKTNDKEGIPGAIVEAMASGLPIISTYHAGIPAVIKNEKNGILIRERDADQLAKHIVDLFEDVELRKELGTAAKNDAMTNLDFLMKAQDLQKIYKSLIN